MSESILTVIPARDSKQRLLVVLCHHPSAGSHLELRQQSWGDGVGWFTQSSVVVEPQQVAALRGGLGHPLRGRSFAARSRVTTRRSPADFEPRIVRAESA